MHSANSRIRRSNYSRRTLIMASPVRTQGGTFQLRRKVPNDLRAALGFEYKRSLKTRDPVVAKQRFAEEWQKSEEIFAAARAQLSSGNSLGLRDVQLLAAKWFRQELTRIEQSGRFTEVLEVDGGGAVEQGDHYVEFEDFVAIRDAVEQGMDVQARESALKAARAFLLSEGISPPVSGSEAHERLLSAFYGHLLKLSDVALLRMKGDWFTQPDLIPEAPLSVSLVKSPDENTGISLSGLFELYATEKRLNDGDTRAVRKTLRDFEAVLHRFTGLMGNLQLGEISREAIAEYRSLLARLPRRGEGLRKLTPLEQIKVAEEQALPRLTEGTIRNQLAALSAVLGFGVRLGKVVENPIVASGIRRAAARAASKRSAELRVIKDYSKQELRLIFTSPIFSQHGWQPPRVDLGRAMYWLPLLLYYTGARREELAQLKVEDVVIIDDVICLSILDGVSKDDLEVRTLKTSTSRRKIPLHLDLIKGGFLDYVYALPKDGMMFPLLKPNPDGYYGVGFGKHWTNYLRSVVKLNTSVSPAHGFRHTFKTLCREVGIAEDVHDAITGHSGGKGVARDYGAMPISRMAEAMRLFPSVYSL